ncbi:MAG: hypothetical protein J2P15_13970 [Micromonosporaceae bacterium]|nr:hypothetical protein [Micromonosporaceae bacterium]
MADNSFSLDAEALRSIRQVLLQLHTEQGQVHQQLATMPLPSGGVGSQLHASVAQTHGDLSDKHGKILDAIGTNEETLMQRMLDNYADSNASAQSVLRGVIQG